MRVAGSSLWFCKTMVIAEFKKYPVIARGTKDFGDISLPQRRVGTNWSRSRD